MRLIINIDLASLPSDPAAEGGHILRDWAGALAQLDLSEPAE